MVTNYQDLRDLTDANKTVLLQSVSGAQGENRTLTPLLAGDFECTGFD